MNDKMEHLLLWLQEFSSRIEPEDLIKLNEFVSVMRSQMERREKVAYDLGREAKKSTLQ